MEEGRETRFTHEVLLEAAERLDARKAELQEMTADGDEPDGMALFDALGWAPMAVMEMAAAAVTQIPPVFGLPVVNQLIAQMIAAAFMDGLAMGAIASDVSWEKSMGLSV